MDFRITKDQKQIKLMIFAFIVNKVLLVLWEGGTHTEASFIEQKCIRHPKLICIYLYSNF